VHADRAARGRYFRLLAAFAAPCQHLVLATTEARRPHASPSGKSGIPGIYDLAADVIEGLCVL
jgi:hypothetical protein